MRIAQNSQIDILTAEPARQLRFLEQVVIDRMESLLQNEEKSMQVIITGEIALAEPREPILQFFTDLEIAEMCAEVEDNLIALNPPGGRSRGLRNAIALQRLFHISPVRMGISESRVLHLLNYLGRDQYNYEVIRQQIRIAKYIKMLNVMPDVNSRLQDQHSDHVLAGITDAQYAHNNVQLINNLADVRILWPDLFDSLAFNIKNPNDAIMGMGDDRDISNLISNAAIVLAKELVYEDTGIRLVFPKDETIDTLPTQLAY